MHWEAEHCRALKIQLELLTAISRRSRREAGVGFTYSSQAKEMKLTRTAVQELELPPRKNELIVFDEEIPGFGVRLRAGGSRNWIVQYKVGKKHRRPSNT
jgi:hypothetical protein